MPHLRREADTLAKQRKYIESRLAPGGELERMLQEARSRFLTAESTKANAEARLAQVIERLEKIGQA
jgi:uncharacterized coiled-coil DUF342 family protein